MDRRFEVFVSYASEDRKFASRLVEWLEHSGLEVWYAEEDMRGGEEVQRQIAATVPLCRHAVFVISADWLRKDWTLWERDLVLEDCPEDRRVLCLMRVPRRVGELGPKLHRLKSIDWRPEEAEEDARFWELLCGLGMFELGKKREWAARGREARGVSGPGIVASTTEEAEARGALQAGRGSPQILTCNRDPQWGALSRLAADGRNEAILIAGPRGQGHRFFLERIVACLPRDPSRRICEVAWTGIAPPQARGTAMAAIAQAIDCAPDQLETTLRRALSSRNLVFVHQPPFEETDCEAMVRYYTEWLPELVRAVDPPDSPNPGKLKFVQAIRWPEVSAIQCGLSQAARLFSKGSGLSRRCAKAEAARTLKERLQQASSPLPVVFLDELGPITREDVEAWSRSLDLDDTSRAKLVEDALDGAAHSADILNRIAERLAPQRRSA